MMTTQTLSKESALAVEHFERKLAFEIGPIGLKYALEAKEPITIVDLRTPEIYANGHIPGSVLPHLKKTPLQLRCLN